MYNHIKSGSVIRILVFLTVSFLISCSKKTADTPNKPVAITSLSVNTGAYNTDVTINGTGFSSVIAEDKVLFNGKSAEIKAASGTKIIAVVPLGAGTGVVSVSVKDGTVVSGPLFSYQFTAVVSTYAGSGAATSVNGTGVAASFMGPRGLAIDASGNLYVTEFGSGTIRKITTGGVVTTLAGSGKPGSDDGIGTAASFKFPGYLAIDALNNIYVADDENYLIRKITPAGVVSTIAGHTSGGYMDGKGINAAFQFPTGIAIDVSGNIFIGDAGNNVIRKIISVGTVSTFAGQGPLVPGTADGTGKNASFNEPSAEVFDASGNLYVSDVTSRLIRKITPEAVVSTLAGGNKAGQALDGKGALASFTFPAGMAIDAGGDLYLADAGDNLIRRITPDGVVTTIAGNGKEGADNGNGKDASFYLPQGIAIDKSGAIYVADTANNLIRKIIMQ